MFLKCFYQYILVLFLFSFVALFTAGAEAKKDQGSDDAQKTPARVEGLIPDFEMYLGQDLKEYSKRSFKPKAYMPITFENFINMYWGMGINTLEDSDAVDSYMLATECSIYNQYISNEFSWHNIRVIARDIISMNTKNFYNRYEFVQPLIFTNYDLRRKGFNIHPDYAFRGTIRLEMGADTTNMPCVYRGGEGQNKFIPNHPRFIGVTVNHPLNINFVSVPPELAKEYIKIYEDIAIATDMPIERRAYIKFKILITNFKQMEELYGGRQRALFFGYIENYEIFADPDLRVSLYKSQTYKGHLNRIKHRQR